jgi:hypothetical protein
MLHALIVPFEKLLRAVVPMFAASNAVLCLLFAVGDTAAFVLNVLTSPRPMVLGQSQVLAAAVAFLTSQTRSFPADNTSYLSHVCLVTFSRNTCSTAQFHASQSTTYEVVVASIVPTIT